MPDRRRLRERRRRRELRHRPSQHDAASEPAAGARPALRAAHRQAEELHTQGGRRLGRRQAGTVVGWNC